MPAWDALFHHNPPSDTDLQRTLFVARERELLRLERYFPGTTSATIRAVHGNSRVGKSHLALRFLQDLNVTHHVFSVPAAGGKKARLILQDLYEDIRNAVLQVEQPAELEEAVSSRSLLDEARALIQILNELLLDRETAREITISSTFKETATFQALASVLGLSAGLSGAAEETQATTTKFTVAAPNDHRLIDFIRELCEILFHTTNRNSIIYVDDIDLLDVGPTADQDQVTVLLRLLQRLSESTRITVAASLRTRHMATGEKGLSEALQVHPLSSPDIRLVYNKHIEKFNDGQNVFEDECLEELIAGSSGQIGNFLRTCKKFLNWADMQGLLESNGNPRLLSLTDLEGFFLAEIRRLKENVNHRAYIEKIIMALGQQQMEVELDPIVMQTDLIYTLLEEPTGSVLPKFYAINRIAAKVWRSL